MSDTDEPNGDTGGVDILGEVTLKSFTATPDHIGPFGVSHLAWSVEGPLGFRLELRGIGVAKVGERTVQPATTTSFPLAAIAGQARRTLGTVIVTVDESQCETYEPLLKPRLTLQSALKNAFSGIQDISLQRDPTVRFSPGRIAFSVQFEVEVPILPNPGVRLNGSFGLGVVDGDLVPIGQTIVVDTSIPASAWFIPGAPPILILVANQAAEQTRAQGGQAVDGLVQLLNAVAIPPDGKRNRSVRIDDGNGGFGIIEITACPFGLLRRFAELSGVATPVG